LSFEEDIKVRFIIQDTSIRRVVSIQAYIFPDVREYVGAIQVSVNE